MAKHGVYVSEQATSVSTPVVVETGIPVFIGTSPLHHAEDPATPGIPVLCNTFEEAVSKLGYLDKSADWNAYSLLEAMYSHFRLYSMSPAIFINVLDPSTARGATPHSRPLNVVNKKVDTLSKDVIPSTVSVQLTAAAAFLVKGIDYDCYWSESGTFVIEVLEGGAAYSATTLIVDYNEVDLIYVTNATIAGGIANVDLCMHTLGIIPDLIVAPGWSTDAEIAAAMAAKAAAINGLFRGKAIVDVDSGAAGARTYNAAVTWKNSHTYTDENMIVCWPKVQNSGRTFCLSTHVAGVLASTDAQYNAPYVSPSNKLLKGQSLVANDAEVTLSLEQANILDGNGIVTGLNFMGGFKVWGNYTGCYPVSTDVKDYFISVSRMVDYIANTLIQTFWGKLDQPMNRRLVDTILDTCNIWLNSLTGSEYILGGRCEMLDSENPLTSLMAGIIKLHVYVTPPSPAKEIDFVVEYDPDYVTSALT